jgi:hypothetical protein
MIGAATDAALLALARHATMRLLGRCHVIPVLHVERLHDDATFERIQRFLGAYAAKTGCRAVATVITPLAPLLRAELDAAGFDVDAYARRIASLLPHADVGLHGHYLRAASASAPVHNAWSERRVVAEQLPAEIEWLESRGLMRTRVYSAGWWYLDDNVVQVLADNAIAFDFSASPSRYNDSPVAHAFRRRGQRGDVFAYGSAAASPRAVWAASSFGTSHRRSSVPRRIARMFWRDVLQRRPICVSLYGHDWDIDPVAAMRTVDDLRIHGAEFVSLERLSGPR